MTPNCTLLRNPALIRFGCPKRTNKSKTFTRDNVFITSDTESNTTVLYVDINNATSSDVLAKVLSKIIAREDWLSFFNLETLYFHWTVGKEQYDSSNPHFELFMRSFATLLSMIYNTVNGETPTISAKDFDKVVETLNLSFIGLGLCELQIPVQGPLHVPVLLCPPFIRKTACQTFDYSEVYVLPDVSIVLLQCLLHTLAAEVWMVKMQGLILHQLQTLSDGASSKYLETKEYYECLCKLTQDFLLDDRNPLLADQQYKQYLHARLNPNNKKSDLNRLFAVANALNLETGEAHTEFVNYISCLASGFTSLVLCALQSKLKTTWSLSEADQGRLTPVIYTPLKNISAVEKEENWATTMQDAADKIIRKTNLHSEELQFDLQPFSCDQKLDSANELNIHSTRDTSSLLSDNQLKESSWTDLLCCC